MLNQLTNPFANRKIRLVLSTVVVLAGLVVLVRLGFWQLDRLEWRRGKAAFTAQQLALPPLALTPDVELPADLTTLKTRRGAARGEFDFANQVALKLQNHNGVPGVHLIAPLVVGDGVAVLVDRGWIPQSEAAPERWTQFDEPGSADVSGFIRLTETAPNATEVAPAGPQSEWYRVDIDEIQAQMPYRLLPVYVLQSPVEGQAELPARVDPQFDLSEGPHLGYAIQWFIFAAILGGGYIYQLTRKNY